MAEKFGLLWQDEPAPRMVAFMAIMGAEEDEKRKQNEKQEKKNKNGRIRPRA